MKVYLSKINESWIIDRAREEWYNFNSNVSTEKINEAEVIWIISPWLWKKIPRRHLKNKKVVCSLYHFEKKDFEKKNLENFFKRDEFVDEYHVISPIVEKQLRELTLKPITYIPFWVNQNIWFEIEIKLQLRKLVPVHKVADFKRNDKEILFRELALFKVLANSKKQMKVTS